MSSNSLPSQPIDSVSSPALRNESLHNDTENIQPAVDKKRKCNIESKKPCDEYEVPMSSVCQGRKQI